MGKQWKNRRTKQRQKEQDDRIRKKYVDSQAAESRWEEQPASSQKYVDSQAAESRWEQPASSQKYVDSQAAESRWEEQPASSQKYVDSQAAESRWGQPASSQKYVDSQAAESRWGRPASSQKYVDSQAAESRWEEDTQAERQALVEPESQAAQSEDMPNWLMAMATVQDPQVQQYQQAGQALVDLAGKVAQNEDVQNWLMAMATVQDPQIQQYQQAGQVISEYLQDRLDETSISGNPAGYLAKSFGSGVVQSGEGIWNAGVGLGEGYLQFYANTGGMNDSSIPLQDYRRILNLFGEEYQQINEDIDKTEQEVSDEFSAFAEDNLYSRYGKNWYKRILDEYDPQGLWATAGNITNELGQALPNLIPNLFFQILGLISQIGNTFVDGRDMGMDSSQAVGYALGSAGVDKFLEKAFDIIPNSVSDDLTRGILETAGGAAQGGASSIADLAMQHKILNSDESMGQTLVDHSPEILEQIGTGFLLSAGGQAVSGGKKVFDQYFPDTNDSKPAVDSTFSQKNHSDASNSVQSSLQPENPAIFNQPLVGEGSAFYRILEQRIAAENNFVDQQVTAWNKILDEQNAAVNGILDQQSAAMNSVLDRESTLFDRPPFAEGENPFAGMDQAQIQNELENYVNFLSNQKAFQGMSAEEIQEELEKMLSWSLLSNGATDKKSDVPKR